MTHSLLYLILRMTAARCFSLSLVMFNVVSLKTSLTVSYYSGLTSNHYLFSFGKQPMLGPSLFILCHLLTLHVLCFELTHHLITAMNLMRKKVMAAGSPG